MVASLLSLLFDDIRHVLDLLLAVVRLRSPVRIKNHFVSQDLSNDVAHLRIVPGKRRIFSFSNRLLFFWPFTNAA